MMKRCEIKFEPMGPAAGDNKSVRILNRVLQWRESGLELEADQRHAELIIKYAGPDSKAKPVGSPGERSHLKTERRAQTWTVRSPGGIGPLWHGPII